jgi:hypothetical protein
VTSCCCAPEQAPALKSLLFEGKPPATPAPAPIAVLSGTALPLLPPWTLGPQAPPGCPLFLQRCTLLL